MVSLTDWHDRAQYGHVNREREGEESEEEGVEKGKGPGGCVHQPSLTLHEIRVVRLGGRGIVGEKEAKGGVIVERNEGDWRGVVLGGLGRVEQGSRATDRGSNGLRMRVRERRKELA